MKILITGGPTREPIDAVRYISNRSSGKMSVALASAAAQAKHEVTLLLGPIESDEAILPDLIKTGVQVERFESSSDLEGLLKTHWPKCDVLVMAAAVADYKPKQTIAEKLARQPGVTLDITLESTPDLVASMAKTKRPGQRVVAFALEENAQLEDRALQKMKNKNVDAIVANSLETMGDDSIEPLWLTAAGGHDAPGRMSKATFAQWLIDRLAGL